MIVGMDWLVFRLRVSQLRLLGVCDSTSISIGEEGLYPCTLSLDSPRYQPEALAREMPRLS
jgi:hypothetical protein